MFDLQPWTNPSNKSKIAFIIRKSGILGHHHQPPMSAHYFSFTTELSRVFDHPVQSSKTESKLLSLH